MTGERAAQAVRIEAPTAASMHALGRRLAAILRPGDLVVLTGDLGAGKTTLTQGLGAALGVRGRVTSPTFVISRIHPSEVGGPALVHVDTYRIPDAAEVADLDLEESLGESVTVVEWGAGLVEALAPDRLEITITRLPDPPEGADPDDASAAVRIVAVAAVGPRWGGADLGSLSG